ncbi:YcnI family protein [Agromyces mariniharenae]|uniref:YcnI family protein n=1 Tax=Agromyces mariniharenae TaxID=2604423 RepID=A0A5S4V562_9MICO|nr:YcnI family protein [Agromyces mariniharenae]TYL54122.1 YcnI family protein [Agromyces mariniharenae]
MRIARLSAAGLAGGAVLALAAVPLAASAHVTVTPSGTAAGSYTVLTFAYSHGCEGSPTTAIAIDIPESIASVSPTLNPNYTIEKVADGDRTSQVVYTAITPVPEGYRDTIELSLQLPEDAAGETLAFPVLQTCEVGETNWNQVAEEGEEEPESPAPVIVVTEATGDGHGHGAATDEAAADEHGDGHADGTEEVAATSGDADTVARVLGIGGLVVGVVGIVLALAARRPRSGA